MTILFSDDFESGSLSYWSAITAITAGETLGISTIDPHRGVFHSRHTTDGSAVAEYAYMYKTFVAQPVVYMRAYIKILTTLPVNPNEYYTLMGAYIFGTELSTVTAFNLAGQTVWRLDYRNGGATVGVNSSVAVTLNVYHCVELYVKVHPTEGAYTLFIDGVPIITITNVDSSPLGNVDVMVLGILWSNGQTVFQVHCDSVLVSDTYIGVDSTFTATVEQTTTSAISNLDGARVRTLRRITTLTPVIIGGQTPITG